MLWTGINLSDMSAGYPVVRPRRLRRTPALRRLVAETSLRPGDLVLPVFIKEGISEPQPISSMPGVVQHTRDSLRKAAAEAAAAGLGGLIVFGVPAVKDGRGSAADDPAGISQLALADLRAEVGDACVVLADLCMCEYTDHGHCGLLTEDGDVSNDATLERYAAIAVAQAAAGADLVAPSGMMDGQVAAIRAALDAAGHGDVGICAYSAKYASGFYGPFREAAEGAPAFGDRASHQQDPANAVEALREVAQDIGEGADMVMVKPALAYLDIIRRVADSVDRAGGGLPSQRRVRDGRGGGGQRLAGPGPDHRRDAHRDPPRGGKRHPDLLGGRGGPPAGRLRLGRPRPSAPVTARGWAGRPGSARPSVAAGIPVLSGRRRMSSPTIGNNG